MRLLIINIFFGLFMLISFNSCVEGNQPERQDVSSKIDSLSKLAAQRKFDSIGMIADFITNSGGRLTTKETLEIYYADTNITGNLVNLGGTLIDDGRIKEGLRCLNKALIKDKGFSPEIFYFKGIAWHTLANRDSMYYYFSKAISLDSENVRYYYNRSLAYAEDSLFEQAINDITESIKIQPNNRSLYVVRGGFKIAIGDFKGAVPDMEEIPVSMKKNHIVFRDRGLIYLKLNDFKRCIKECNISIGINPTYGNVYGVRAAAKSQLGDYDGAYEDLRRAVELGDKESIPYLKQYEEFYRTHKKT